jgi:hypothetical protein
MAAEGFAPPPSLLPAGGDVASARACATRILSFIPLAPDPCNARLVLTAITLHLGSQNGPEPTLGDLLNSLASLSKQVGPPPEFLRSPLQFLHYAALEIGDLDPAARADAFEVSVRATATAASECDRRTA